MSKSIAEILDMPVDTGAEAEKLIAELLPLFETAGKKALQTTVATVALHGLLAGGYLADSAPTRRAISKKAVYLSDELLTALEGGDGE